MKYLISALLIISNLTFAVAAQGQELSDKQQWVRSSADYYQFWSSNQGEEDIDATFGVTLDNKSPKDKSYFAIIIKKAIECGRESEGPTSTPNKVLYFNSHAINFSGMCHGQSLQLLPSNVDGKEKVFKIFRKNKQSISIVERRANTEDLIITLPSQKFRGFHNEVKTAVKAAI